MTGRDATGTTADALLREYFVALGFRFRHVTEGAPETFGGFEAGAGVRTPAAIVLHMTGLLVRVREAYEPGTHQRLEPLPFAAECDRFHAALAELDRIVAAGTTPVGDLDFGQLWRGPLSDVMTHVGQLATLRRLAGAPIERIRYPHVEMPPIGG